MSAVWTEAYAIGTIFQLVGLAAATIFARRAWMTAHAANTQASKFAKITSRAYLTMRA